MNCFLTAEAAENAENNSESSMFLLFGVNTLRIPGAVPQKNLYNELSMSRSAFSAFSVVKQKIVDSK